MTEGSGIQGSSEESDYYRTIERDFVERRGDPLVLSNADWLLIRRWRKRGLPLRVVLRGIRDAFDAHQYSWARAKKVRSLRYCDASVMAAAEHWHRALELGREGSDLPARLGDFAAALRQASGLGPAASREASGLVSALDERARDPGRSEELDRWLQQCEKKLVASLRRDLGDDVAGVEAEVDATLAAYRDRMPEKVMSQIREESITRHLLERAGLPRFSLFH